MPSLNGFYYSWTFDDNESDEEDIRACLGLGDSVMFDFMLLLILPPFSSMKEKLYITIGHIIAVQIGRQIVDKLSGIYNQCVLPDTPLPVIVVSLYAVLLNTYIEY
jgi:hypothetical protein